MNPIKQNVYHYLVNNNDYGYRFMGNLKQQNDDI